MLNDCFFPCMIFLLSFILYNFLIFFCHHRIFFLISRLLTEFFFILCRLYFYTHIIYTFLEFFHCRNFQYFLSIIKTTIMLIKLIMFDTSCICCLSCLFFKLLLLNKFLVVRQIHSIHLNCLMRMNKIAFIINTQTVFSYHGNCILYI